VTSSSTTTAAFREVPIAQIDEPENPTRSEMDDQKLDELARDIRLRGILQPLGLVTSGDRFQVVYGHRRLMASQLAGLVTVPARVWSSREAALDGAQYAENRFREDINPADEADWFADLLERKCHGDVEQLIALLGEKEDYVQGRLLLFKGDEKVFAALRRGEIGIGHAHELNKVKQPQYRAFFLDLCVRSGLKVRELARQIDNFERSALASEMNAGAIAPEPIMASAPAPSLMRCEICGDTDHPETMLWIHVHSHCKLAVLDKLLASYRGSDS